MQAEVESTTRGPKDFFHFGIIFLGVLFAISGVVITSIRIAILGLVLIAFGMAFFLVHSHKED